MYSGVINTYSPPGVSPNTRHSGVADDSFLTRISFLYISAMNSGCRPPEFQWLLSHEMIIREEDLSVTEQLFRASGLP